jgi:hypothetical protein
MNVAYGGPFPVEVTHNGTSGEITIIYKETISYSHIVGHEGVMMKAFVTLIVLVRKVFSRGNVRCSFLAENAQTSVVRWSRRITTDERVEKHHLRLYMQ